jgi:iron(III) transport system substrate-binding protein
MIGRWTRTLWLLTLVIAVAGCTATAKPPPEETARSAGGSGQPALAVGEQAPDDWEQVVQAARKEGRIVVAGPTGAANREMLMRFPEFYPGIQLEYSSISGRDLPQRLLTERQAGQYLWDVHIGGPNTIFGDLKPRGVLDPVRPAIRPDLQRDELWYGGFDFGWADLEQQYAFMFSINAATPAGVNRDFVSRQEFDHPRQLIDPRWKGRITMDDPTTTGAGARQFAVLLDAYGEDFGRRLLKDQEPVFTRERRQFIEWMVRGRYPIGIGAVTGGDLAIFLEQGLGRNIETLAPPELVMLSPGPGTMSLVNRAPHPNAARVFINWVLSREAQELWGKTQYNSRRTDVAPSVPEEFPDPQHLKSMVWNAEAWEPVRHRAERFAKDLLGG